MLRGMMSRIAPWLLLGCLVLPQTALAEEPRPEEVAGRFKVSPSDTLPATPAQEREALEIGKRLVSLCPDCPLSTICDGHCYWSTISRVIIQNAVVKGYDEEAIVKAYVATYGPRVLAWSTESGFFLVSWALPYLTLVGALGVLLIVGLRMRKARLSTEAATPSEARAPHQGPGKQATAGSPEDAATRELARALHELGD